MDRTIDKADLTQDFDAVVGDLRSGDAAVVIRDGEPVARLTALTDGEKVRVTRDLAFERMMAWFEAQEPIVIGPWTREELYERDPQ